MNKRSSLRAQKFTRLLLVAIVGWLSHWNAGVIILALVLSSEYVCGVQSTPETPLPRDVVRISVAGDVKRGAKL